MNKGCCSAGTVFLSLAAVGNAIPDISKGPDEKMQVLSVAVGARLPLPGQQMFGFEVKHVAIGFSLLTLTVHTFLRVFHDRLNLPCHLKDKEISSDLKMSTISGVRTSEMRWSRTFASRKPDLSRGGREALWLRTLDAGGAEGSRFRFLATLRDCRACCA